MVHYNLYVGNDYAYWETLNLSKIQDMLTILQAHYCFVVTDFCNTDMQENMWARLRDSRPGACLIHAT